MRARFSHVSWAAALTLAAAGLSACSRGSNSTNDELARDLALASSSDGLALAPSQGNARSTVSAMERTGQSLAPAPAQRVTSYRRAPRAATQAAVTPAAASAETAPVAEQTVATSATPGDAQPTIVPQARPVSLPAPSSGGTVMGNDLPGTMGGGGGWGVVIRGGPVGDDHCDPRRDGRRGGGIQISVNNRIPGVPGRF